MHKNNTKETSMKIQKMICCILLGIISVSASESNFNIANEYIRSLAAVYGIQQNADKEPKSIPDGNDKMTKICMTTIRNAERYRLELGASINNLTNMKTNDTSINSILSNTIAFYNAKTNLYNELSSIAKDIIGLSSNDIDKLKQLAPRIPEINAKIEFIDESLVDNTVLIFSVLIDKKPDSNGKMSRLNITKDEKQSMLKSIEILFGKSVDQKNKNWTVGSAALMKEYLLKGYKCKDEIK